MTARVLTVETPRLLLRPVLPVDAAPTAALVTPDVSEQLLTWSSPSSTGQILERIAEAQALLASREAVNWAIFGHEGAPLMGWIGLVRERGPIGKIGYWIGKSFRGQGFMTEAARYAIPVSARYLGLGMIRAGVYPHNRSSIKVLVSLGFRRSGAGRVYSPVSGEIEDILRYKLKPDRRCKAH